ncbi:hypothetical protein G9A89_000294 [Geosiphon pyriformis]|nr:hypothetical protein G9A89_000294 [Geosiphon pyriformis]
MATIVCCNRCAKQYGVIVIHRNHEYGYYRKGMDRHKGRTPPSTEGSPAAVPLYTLLGGYCYAVIMHPCYQCSMKTTYSDQSVGYAIPRSAIPAVIVEYLGWLSVGIILRSTSNPG